MTIVNFAGATICALLLSASIVGCDQAANHDSDQIQQQQQETLLKESVREIGMPAIKNFREKKILKDILELRDQANLVTYTYLQSEYTGKLVYLGESIGYGIPAATQFTSPSKAVDVWPSTNRTDMQVLPQADPNGLFSPASAEGTWVLLKDPNGKDVKPVYIEPRIIVSPFKLPIGAQ